MKRKLSKIGILLLVLVCTKLAAQENGIETEASYTGDAVYNFNGGIKTGGAYLGMIDLGITFNTEQLKLYKGGELFVHMQNTHGGTPTEKLVGDMQVFDNIENGNASYLYEFWYKQTLGPFSILVGKHDLNSEFLASDYSGEYINSSFGIMGLAPLNVPVSIFPKTSLATVAKLEITDDISFAAGLYDGDPLDLGVDPYGLDLSMDNEQGFISISEFTIISHISDKTGTYKIGGFHHTADYTGLEDTSSMYNGNYGFYFVADQQIYAEENEGQGLVILFQAGWVPQKCNLNDFYLAAGLNYYGLLPGRDDDIIGLSMAYASVCNKLAANDPMVLNHETVIEFTYKLGMGEHFEFQPDLQYIINPGANADLNNAFIGLLRTCITF